MSDLYWPSLTGNATRCEKENTTADVFCSVLKGACLANFPDLITEIDEYKRVTCPVLLLTVHGDDAHPVSTAKALHKVLPQSELHISPDKKSAARDWPDIISKFLQSLPPQVQPFNRHSVCNGKEPVASACAVTTGHNSDSKDCSTNLSHHRKSK